MGARALTRGRCDPRRSASGDRALGSSCRNAHARGRRPSCPRRRVRRAAPGPSAVAPAHDRRRGGSPRDGHPRSGQEPRRRGVRRPGLRPSQPRRARRLAACARRRARRRAGVGGSANRPRQHVPDAHGEELRGRDGARGTGSRRAASGSTRRWRRRRSTSSSGCSSGSARSRARPSCGLARESPASSLRPPRCARSANSSRLRPTKGSSPSSNMPSLRRPPDRRAQAGVFVAAAALRAARLGAGTRAARTAGAAPRLRLEPGRLARGAGCRRRPPRRRGRRGDRERTLPAPRRPADLLVPTAAARAPARLRAATQCRTVTLGPDRHEPGPPDPGDDPRRPLHRRLSSTVEKPSRAGAEIALSADPAPADSALTDERELEVLAPVIADGWDEEVEAARLRARLPVVETGADEMERPDERSIQREDLEVVGRGSIRRRRHLRAAVAWIATHDPRRARIVEARPPGSGQLLR